jgi:alkylhydroperoxidase family enzyme
MARIKLIETPEDLPAAEVAAGRKLAETLEALFPGGRSAGAAEFSGGWAITAHNPRLTSLIAALNAYVAGEMPWCRRTDLRELAVQTLNLHYRCEPSFRAHLPYAQHTGITAEMQAAIPYWRTSKLFDDEQKLVIEYVYAAVTGEVPEPLFKRVVAQFGEQGAVECTAVVGMWSFWAMMINAVDP